MKKKQRYGQGERVFKISDLCCFTSGQGVRYKLKHEIGNQGDMEKIHVKQQFFEARGPQGQFFLKKTMNPFLHMFFGWSGDRVQTDTPTHIHTSNTPTFTHGFFIFEFINNLILIFSIQFIMNNFPFNSPVDLHFDADLRLNSLDH